MRIENLTKLALGAVLALGLGGIKDVRAEYPEKPITLILPLGAGGSHDRNARVFTSVIPDILGQPIIVKLMPGASGQVGTSAAAKAKADGYTLLFTHNYYDQLQKHVKKLPYNTDRDFVTVGSLNSGLFSVIVHADSPHKTWQDLVKYAKANSGKLKFAHSGNWGATHAPALQLFTEAGIADKVVMVPYKGGGPSMRGFLAREADFTFQFISTIKAQGDKVRVLISAGKKSSFKGSPTFADLGYTSDIGQMYRVIMAPKGIPADRLAKLQSALVKLQGHKTYKRLIKAIGEKRDYVNGPEYEKLRPMQSAAYKKMVQGLMKK
ncbi:MAG: tripartite tricarboxylate transporter substrate binding protein [Pseudomonadota bacterium]|nr:tripartite tricarboxylate transporter substrate binding protein [Pseudomonadota bacterium]